MKDIAKEMFNYFGIEVIDVTTTTCTCPQKLKHHLPDCPIYKSIKKPIPPITK